MRSTSDKSDYLNGVLFTPPSDWVSPTKFPDLRQEKIISIDVETDDPHLNDRGPGFIRGDAKVAGIAIAIPKKSWYFPIAHLGGGNMDPVNVKRWLGDQLHPSMTICGMNLQYELEALDSMGIDFQGRCMDVQVAEALIDEEQDGYSLDIIGRRWVKSGKDEEHLRSAATAYGVDPKSGLWKLPAKHVGAYAERDAAMTLDIFKLQLDEMRKQDLLPIFELESKLLPILWKMRKRGILIDIPAAEKLNAKLMLDESEERGRLKSLIGYDLDPWSGPQIARLCQQRKIVHPITLKGNPSFTGEWLSAYSDEAIQQISRIREVNRMRKTFIEDWIFGNQIRGRIHPQWKQLASDDGGTRTGRMACSNPNAQQVPAGKYRMTGEANEFGKAIRALFISDTGKWGKFDYKQQEPKILIHFAALCDFTGAKLARMAYKEDPKMDFYNYMVELAAIDRRPAKDMFLGRCYGMGKNKLAMKLGKSLDECAEILRRFDEMVPFVKEIQESCEQSAQRRGYIKTILGRRRHFNRWEPADTYNRREDGEYVIAKPKAEAEKCWPNARLVRSDTRKALNSLIQGSAADMTKAAMVKLFEMDGTLPYMQVHDELDIGLIDNHHTERCQEIIENCVDITVPISAELSVGRHWK